MAVTSSKLKAVIEADVTKGVANVRLFSQEFKKAEQEADKDAKAIQKSVETGMNGAGQAAKKGATDIAAVFKGSFAANAAWDMVKGLGNGITSLIGGILSTVGSVGKEAFGAVMEYESMTRSLQQLTATQLVEAGAAEDMASALALAEQPAKDLLGWVEQLAIKSPFNSDQIASGVQLAEAFQFSQGEAKRLTQDLVDFVAAANKPPETLNRITLSLGQMKAAGKVTGVDLRELANAGLPVINILAKAFDVSSAKMSAMVSDGAVPATKAIRAIEEYLEGNFSGAAARATNTWQGLVSSFQDIKKIDLRSLFGGIFEAIQPEVANIMGILSSDSFKERLRGIGKDLGDGVKAGIATVKGLIQDFTQSGAFDGIKSMWAGLTGKESVDATNVIKGLILGTANFIVNAVAMGKSFAEVMVGMGKTAWEFFDMMGVGITLLSNKWSAFMDGMKYAGMSLSAAMKGDFTNMANYARDSKAAFAESELAGSNYNDRMAVGQERIAGIIANMKDNLASINKDKEKGLAIVAQEGKKYDEMIDKVRNPDKYFIGPKQPMAAGGKGNVWGNFMSGVATGVQNPAVKAALEKTLEDTGGDVGGKAGKKTGTNFLNELEKAIGKAQGILQKGVSDSISLGRVGGPEPGAPGSDSWAENIFRLQDVAQNLGTGHEGKDTRKWYEMFFGGQSFEEASAQAKATVQKFQAGMLMDPQVMQYLDVGKARGLIAQQLEGERQSAQFAKLVGGDESVLGGLLGISKVTGKDKRGSEQVDAAAKILKGQMVDSVSKISGESPTVMDAMVAAMTQTTGGKTENATVDLSGFSGNFMTAMDKEILAKKSDWQQRGKNIWIEVETGFVEGAKQSTALLQAIDGMVEKSLKVKLQNGQYRP